MSIYIIFYLILFILCSSTTYLDSSSSISNIVDDNNTITNELINGRIYGLRKCAGSGCPYAASWLSNINLYRQVTWWLDITKMEAASFGIFDKAKLKFQLNDPDAYYVHHMSMFEHLNHKKYGFEVAKNKTLILSKTAFDNECHNLIIKPTQKYLALIPFYGGLPPGVTKDLSVKSIGQGNSLVDGHTKALQTMATVCSCLKYFGYAVIGVARDEDRMLINDMLYEKMSSSARHHINVIQFKMAKPANLPFHLLSWGQQYIKIHNCHSFYPLDVVSKQHRQLMDTTTISGSIHPPQSVKSSIEALDLLKFTLTNLSSINMTHHVKNFLNNKGSLAWSRWNDIFNSHTLNISNLPNEEEYEICHPNAIARSRGGPVNVVYMKKIDPYIFNPHYHHKQYHILQSHTNHSSGSPSPPVNSNNKSNRLLKAKHIRTNETNTLMNQPLTHTMMSKKKHKHMIYSPIKYAYFTECDQILRFDDMITLEALSKASNHTCFFVSRRREKSRDTDPLDYMGNLDMMRNCGVEGYSLSWPKEYFVRMDT